MQTTPDRTAWLKGGTAECRVKPQIQTNPHRLILLGAPGVGKGTQAALLHKSLKACHLSTGDIFRAAKRLDECERTPAMTNALGYMRRGELVPDEIVLDLLLERARCLKCGGGFLLDGFPRTVAQAEALDDFLKTNNLRLDAVVYYEMPLDKLVSRCSGRRVCPNCKAVYHLETLKPKMGGICDICGTALYQREDDREESVRVRMDAYEKSTAPLVNYYRKTGLLITISAEGQPKDIAARTLAALNDHDKQAFAPAI